jgi:hypothetical protein
MSNRDIRIEAVSLILEELGLSATHEQIATIADDFAAHIAMENEQESHRFVGSKSECEKCKRLEKQITELESDLNVFRDSVRKRRHLSPGAPVYVEGNSVLYDRE